ncbi:hypothetical protein AWC38_SpisGene11300 [Stylophora pistillata]|uniref:Uncharacterized protein n=1 Tax=Stylophora pistillata TaxID=50429 RepID=A0A2B4S0C1_STYPI|nr:hypothetical protein AWC38_SpisGene11300 [Stylophora pistillata]
MDAKDAELLMGVNILLLLSLLKRRIAARAKKKFRFWVRQVLRERETYGAFHTLFNELRLFDREYFFRLIWMTPERFEHLLSIVGPFITHYCRSRRPISASERLCLCLRVVMIEVVLRDWRSDAVQAEDGALSNLRQVGSNSCKVANLNEERIISHNQASFKNVYPAPYEASKTTKYTNPGYVSCTLITTTAFMAGSSSTLQTATQEMPLNIFSTFVGPPTTGKSQALKACAISPMESVTAEADSASPVIQKCTSSGMIKTVADIKRGFFFSAEIYEVLFKLLKSDEENATCDVQALCQLFSEEEASYRYATEKKREIAANTPFCISGATQIPFAARLVALLDQENGLLDRFLITFSKCLRPTPNQTSQAIEALKESALSSINDVFAEIARLHLYRSTYTLNQEAKETMNTVNEEFITEVNEAMLEGTTPPKTKKIDIILRVAAALHIFNHVTAELLQRRKPTQPADEIEHSTLLCAIDYVAWTESQKEIFVEVSNLKSF